MAPGEFKTFGAYVDSLETIADEVLAKCETRGRRSAIHPILNGQPAHEFRDQVPLQTRRSAGAFFTSAALSRRLAEQIPANLPSDAIIADPACGIGDLLLAAARKLPTAPDLRGTLRIWGSHLMGFDVEPEFVRATKTRLLLLAMLRSRHIVGREIAEVDRLFPMICTRDFIASPQELARASHILINPPYNSLLAPSDCTWGNRKISAAALFMDVCLSNATGGAKIGALLPDVLRSGTYYERWRRHIESLSEGIELSTYGQFDRWTDINVFTLRLVRGKGAQNREAIWWKTAKPAQKGEVGDYFEVRVGPVVPHRDPEEGPFFAYVHAKNLPAWGKVKRINERRRFAGTTFEPPFVAVRRTSRPGDKRAIAATITGNRKVAVENHIIVLLPKRKTITECQQLVRSLKSRRTDRWLDKRIRCRHLTVGALKDLPWWRMR